MLKDCLMPISYGPWEAYPWKNELALHRERVAIHFAEMLQEDFSGDYPSLENVVVESVFLSSQFRAR
jgi:hypothetical protein